MLLPMSWLRMYVETPCTTKEISDKITLSGTHVESIDVRQEPMEKIIVGEITKVEDHPNADKLVVCHVNTGNDERIIVTGAKNVFEGAKVPVALEGAVLADGTEIKSSDFRGVNSQGMLCSLEEVGVDASVIPVEFRDGIHILPEDTELGERYDKVLGLDDEVLELEITPNRPDCLSILGVSIETAASLEQELELPEIHVKEESEKSIEELFNGIEIETDYAPRFYSRVLTDVVIKPSPQWLQNELMASGVRPVNNIVDLTNFVMLEYGQPLHAYDLDKIEGRKIIVRQAEEGEKLTTLDDVERTLRPEDIVIADEKNILGLAGIMGGLDSEVESETTIVLLEGANFDSAHVRKSAKHFGLRTEASNRFEKGMDAEKAKLAVDRVAELFETLDSGQVAKGSIDVYPNPYEPFTIESKASKINSHLGTKLTAEEMKTILNRLHLPTEVDGDELKTEIPSFRMDLSIWQDIAEEVGRVYGFANIEPQPLKGTLTRGGRPKFRQVEEQVKEILLGAGFNECMTYSFMSPSAFDRIHIPKDSELRKVVSIENPLGEEYSVMRSTLIPNMLDILVKNSNAKNEVAYGFEFGNVFSQDVDDENLPKESLKLTLGFYGDNDFYFLKEVIQNVFDTLNIHGIKWVREEENSFFHTGRAASIYREDEYLGTIGEIHPVVAKINGLKKRVYMAELEFSQMVELSSDERIYQPIPRYPGISRDLAFIVDQDLPVGDIVDSLKESGNELVESIKVFDIYTGEHVDKDKKSVALTIKFRHQDRTLVEEEVNDEVEDMIQTLREEYQAELRK